MVLVSLYTRPPLFQINRNIYTTSNTISSIYSKYWKSCKKGGHNIQTVKKEFETLVYQSIKSQGLDELHSKLIATLYSESGLMTLKELSEKTNYSFSAVSAAMNFLTKLYIVEKIKKSGSKKLYFSIQRDMMKMTLNQVKSKNELMVAPAILKLPAIIQRCENSKSEGSEEMLQILEQYYQQMIAVDKIMKKLVEFTENIQKEVNKI